MITPVVASVLPKEKKTIDIGQKEFRLCDKDAHQNAVRLAQFFAWTSEKGYVLYGHQNDLHRKAGPSKDGFSHSDTFDVTNNFAAVTGIDALSLFGTEHGKWCWSRQNRLDAAVQLSMDGVEKGAIVSLSAHMPNFQLIYERLSGIEVPNDRHWSGWESHPMVLVDGSTNFSGYTPNDLRGNVVEDIMPGKKLNSLYTEYLDLVCDYFLELDKKNVAAIWRPFHENTGGWFWWGCNTCTPEQFRNLWKYTWDYMTNQKSVHNIVWAYSPGTENKCESDFLERYPGDDFVDMVGFDAYQQYPDNAEKYWTDFEQQCVMLSTFAENHKKLFANTETGVAHPDNKALLDSGNEDLDWYCKVAKMCQKYGACYFLLWANFSARGSYYSPYITEKKLIDNKITYLEGHELLDSFIRMFNLDFTVFSGGTGDIWR